MRVILLRFGELYLKGNNRSYFENTLINNIKKKLEGEDFRFEKTFGRYIISNYNPNKENEIIEKLQKVFGLQSLSVADEVEASVETIKSKIQEILLDGKSFKVFVKRADKTFPITSMDFAKELGGLILSKNHKSCVELYNPEVEIHVDIRLNHKAYIFKDTIKCQGGLPLSCSGNGLLLLSGGIDSPVAGYLIAKRGMKIDALHFHSYPYTSLQAKEKVIALANKISDYVGNFKLHIVSFTNIQEEIHKKCSPEFMITIMRRIMMRVAEKICKQNNLQAIITGESLGQVASQTIQSMTCTGNTVDLIPILRPCIAMDKEDIMKISYEIKTYDTSILPYEDCCTVFLPKNPVIKPKLEKCEAEERKLDVDDLVENCILNEEIIEIGI